MYYCPFCNELIQVQFNENKLIKFNFEELNCIKSDHEFWSGLDDNSWIIIYRDLSLSLMANDHSLYQIRNGKKVDILITKLTPTQAANLIKKYIKLKTFL